MARVHVAFATAMFGAPLAGANPESAETLDSGAIAVTSTITAGNANVAVVTAEGSVWVAIGRPATADNSWLVLEGQTREFGVVPAGATISVLDA